MSSRDEYIEKMKQQLDEWNEEIGRLEARVAKATEPARQKLEAQLAKLRESYAAGRTKLDEVRAAGEGKWEEVRAEAEHVWKAMRQSFNYFKSQL